MRPKALKVLVVADDRPLLRQLSKFLNLVGYAVQQTTEAQAALAAIEGDHPDFLIVDSDLDACGGRELCQAVCGIDAERHVYTLQLIDEVDVDRLTDALQEGVDDFLTRPIVFGELLARLRAGARVLEQERRLRDQAGLDALTGLPNRSAFGQRLQAELAGSGSAASLACALVNLDFFRRINYAHGHRAGDRLLQAVAQTISNFCVDNETAASFGGDQFAILLPDASETEATAWADRVRRAVAELTGALGDATMQLTASVGVAATQRGGSTADELIESAAEALQAAKRSGRNCVVSRTELDEDSRAWSGLAGPGRLFERTLARDVMTPCALALQAEDTLSHAAALFHRTQVHALPVVDDSGRLLGLVTDASVLRGPGEASRSTRVVRDVLTIDPPQFDEETSFASLMDFFTRDPRSLAVIKTGDRPTGIVTRGALAALSEPLTTETFAPRRPFSRTSDFLLVPEACAFEQG